ncbi:hypothetical protein RW092_03515 [Paenibacillus sp. 3LSP]|jgi:hypothetical protein|nr:hypothetical protein [Paenibacillus sp. 3LSP]MDU0329269.1 hypothetical protein [Paenibacillus sp. 3LSP]
MIRIGVFNGAGSRDNPQPIIIKSEGAAPNPSIVSYIASKKDKPKDKNS